MVHLGCQKAFFNCVLYVFLYRNKSSVENLSRLVIHPHQGSIYSACFSHDGTKVASCGANKMLKVLAEKVDSSV